jgi:thioredoxin 1
MAKNKTPLIIRTDDSQWATDVAKPEGTDLVLVLFTAEWCNPCEQLRPVLQAVAEKHPEIRVFDYDMDHAHKEAEHYNVSAIPTLLLFKNGVTVGHTSGHQSVGSLEAFLARCTT